MLTLVKHILFSGFIVIAVLGCSTLSKKECKIADWKTIGFEDGVKGYKASRIGQHRSACAEYGIRPDLNTYNAGRGDGLRHYCIPAIAYKKGLSGHSYNGVCTGYNEGEFLDAFNHGLKIHDAEKTLNNLKNNYSQEEDYIAQLEDKLDAKENILVSGKLSKVKAIMFLKETKEIAEELGNAKNNLEHLDVEIHDQLRHIEYLRNQRSYL